MSDAVLGKMERLTRDLEKQGADPELAAISRQHSYNVRARNSTRLMHARKEPGSDEETIALVIAALAQVPRESVKIDQDVFDANAPYEVRFAENPKQATDAALKALNSAPFHIPMGTGFTPNEKGFSFSKEIFELLKQKAPLFEQSADENATTFHNAVRASNKDWVEQVATSSEPESVPVR